MTESALSATKLYPRTEAGKSMPRLEAQGKANGKAIYTADMKLPGMLYGALLTSPYPHARIKSYDCTEALALPGVKAVLTGNDFEVRRIGLCVRDETVLAIGKVRYIGESVAAVAATSPELAREAARLIRVEYEELPAVFTIEDAIAADAPVLHDEFHSYMKIYDASSVRHPNELMRSHMEIGDVDAGFADCDVIVEKVYETSAQYHAYLEPNVALARVDERGKITVWSSTQSVFRTQFNVHESLGIPMSRVRAVAPSIGGGFGGKSEATVQPIAVALAQKTGRPVLVELTREEDMITQRTRHPSRIRMKTGARRDGTLVAREVEAFFDGGAYADDTPAVMNFALFFSPGPYRYEHLRINGQAYYTNKMRAGAFRGFGNPQANFASESQIDEVAAALGMDPLKFRLKNIVQPGDRWIGGQTITNSGLQECIDAVVQASGYHERAKSPMAAENGKQRGLGLGLSAHICAFLSTSAIVRLAEDGTVSLNTGAVDLGQGSDTALSQICADRLGLSVGDVNIILPDTDSSPYNSGTNASRVTYMVGKAVADAAGDTLKQMIERAADMLDTSEDEIEMRPGGILAVKSTNASVTFQEVAIKSLWFADGGGPIIGRASVMHNDPLDPKYSLVSGMVSFDNVGVFTFGAQIVDVEIDTVTGKAEIQEAWCAHDAGRAINPEAVHGQIQGGFVQGAGYALCEEMIWDGGRLTNPSLMDYKIPGALDVPYEINTYVIEVPEPSHPYGAKGVGEPPLIAAAGAVANAVAAAGVRVRKLPITAERVLNAMEGDDGVEIMELANV